jgi:hypothetical protein
MTIYDFLGRGESLAFFGGTFKDDIERTLNTLQLTNDTQYRFESGTAGNIIYWTKG